MNTELIIDASMLRDFSICRELFRYRWVENIVELKPNIHLEFGSAVHRAVECFWKNLGYEAAMAAALEAVSLVDCRLLNPAERDKWAGMVDTLPDMVAAYFAKHEEAELDTLLMVEEEWQQPYGEAEAQPFYPEPFQPLCVLAGKIDRFHGSSPYHLVEVKTATPFGRNWKDDLRKQYLRDIGLALYDWFLCQDGSAPEMVSVEVVTKSKQPTVELIDLPEIISYRQRSKQLIDWLVKDIIHHCTHYAAAKPWPMADGTICRGKYGECPYLHLCLYGATPKNLEKYKPREEHLNVRREAARA